MTTPDRFPVPVRSAVKSNLTNCCNQNLSNRALNILTSTTLNTKKNTTSFALRVGWSRQDKL